MLAYYVEWHMREAWRAMLFADEDLKPKTQRDPVASAKRSVAALRKAATHTLDDGLPAHSFRTLLQELSTIVRNTCQPSSGVTAALTFQMTTTAEPYPAASYSDVASNLGVDTHATAQIAQTH